MDLEFRSNIFAPRLLEWMTLVVLIALSLVTVAFWLRRRKGLDRKVGVANIPKTSQVCEPAIEEFRQTPVVRNTDYFAAWQSACRIAEDWIKSSSGNIEEHALLEDRMEVLRESFPANQNERNRVEEFALAAVGLYDELEWMKQSATDPGSIAKLSRLREAIAETLTLCEVELIECSEWNPALQRPVAVEHTTDTMPSPRIIRFGQTGLRVSGVLLRKQEVVLLSN